MGEQERRDDECVFCGIVRGTERAHVLERTEDTVTFHPLNPVTPGHLLVVPVAHVADLAEDIEVTAVVFRQAAALVAMLRAVAGLDAVNLITSMGAAASQTMPHLHVHVVPRADGDGLTLPWTETDDGAQLDYLGKLYRDRLAEAGIALAMAEQGDGERALITPLGEPLVHALAAAGRRAGART